MIAEGEDGVAAQWGVIHPTRNTPVARRLGEIVDALDVTISSQRPHVVAVERPFVKENIRAAMALGQAQAAAFIAAARYNLDVAEYAPREVKRIVSGDGGAEKEAMAESLRLEFGLLQAPEPLDAADALAVAYCHLLSQRLDALIASQA